MAGRRRGKSRACPALRLHLSRNVGEKFRALAPTFRSSCSIAAPTFTNFGKSWAPANLLDLVPLYRSEVPDRTRRLRCMDFRSAVLVSEPAIERLTGFDRAHMPYPLDEIEGYGN